MPSLEKEEMCQPSTKINVLEEPGGGALLDVCGLGKNAGKVGIRKPSLLPQAPAPASAEERSMFKTV